MKNLTKFLGIIAVGAMIGFFLAGCGDTSGPDTLPPSEVGDSAPDAPTGVSATAISSDSIRVSWNAVSGATEYTVYYSASASGTYSYLGTTSSTSYTTSGWSPYTTVYFKVTASNSYGESSLSSYYAYATTSSGSGSSMPWDGYTVTTLNSSTLWQTGYSLSTSSPARWFKATTTSSNYLNTVLAARDRNYSASSYSVDVKFEVYGTDGIYQRSVDVGGGNHTTTNAFITWTSPGTVYIKVVPYSYSSNSSGSFAIYFNTSALQ